MSLDIVDDLLLLKCFSVYMRLNGLGSWIVMVVEFCVSCLILMSGRVSVWVVSVGRVISGVVSLLEKYSSLA